MNNYSHITKEKSFIVLREEDKTKRALFEIHLKRNMTADQFERIQELFQAHGCPIDSRKLTRILNGNSDPSLPEILIFAILTNTPPADLYERFDIGRNISVDEMYQITHKFYNR